MALLEIERNNLNELWAAPEVRPSAGALMEANDWARSLPALRPLRAIEWYFECSLLGYEILRGVVQISEQRRGGVPVLKGTRFTVAQVLAELGDSSGVQEVASNFDLDPVVIKEMLDGLSLILMRPIK
jgi:uncharacterized protein (DUF433 family)